MSIRARSYLHVWTNIKSFLKRNEGHLSGAAFIIGFIVDSLLLPRIDFWGAYALLGAYLLLIMTTILLTALHEANHSIKKYFNGIAPVLPIVTQFFFGSLMSAIFIYYSRSASIVESAPFMLLLLVVFVGNELFRERLRRLEFQIGLLFFITYMGMIFAVPVFMGATGPLIFLLSGAVAVVVIFFYILVLRFFTPNIIARGKRVFVWSISGILLVVNGLYFTHLIPPIPLSLRVAGVYHSLERTPEGIYKAQGEKMSLRDRITKAYPVVHITQEPLYFFSAIFAPTTFTTSIVHVWQYYEKDTKKWVTKSRSSFPIIGGRDGGYRGYSIKVNLIPGHWRVRVETIHGEVLGSVTFITVPATEPIVFENYDL